MTISNNLLTPDERIHIIASIYSEYKTCQLELYLVDERCKEMLSDFFTPDAPSVADDLIDSSRVLRDIAVLQAKNLRHVIRKKLNISLRYQNFKETLAVAKFSHDIAAQQDYISQLDTIKNERPLPLDLLNLISSIFLKNLEA